MKVSASTTLEAEELERVARIARADSRTIASVLRLAVLRGLPAIERDVLGPQFAGRDVSRVKVTPAPAAEKAQVGA